MRERRNFVFVADLVFKNFATTKLVTTNNRLMGIVIFYQINAPKSAIRTASQNFLSLYKNWFQVL